MINIAKHVSEKWVKFNQRNILENLLQAEDHTRHMQTLSWDQGEGACILKHIIFVRGELKELISHSSDLGMDTSIYENVLNEIDEFLDKVEAGKIEFHKVDLIQMLRRWRKNVEKTMPHYRTFYCKCWHGVPYLKILFTFLLGVALGVFLASII